MMTPAETLYDDIEQVDKALEPYSAPHVNERSGLRWMERTLRQRREHIVSKIAEAERSTVSVAVRSASGGSTLPLSLTIELLEAVQTALFEAGDEVDWPDALSDEGQRAALTLELVGASSSGDEWEAVLGRPSGPFEAQPLTASGDMLAIDAALTAVAEALGGDSGDIGALTVEHGVSVELTITPATTEPATVAIDRHHATTT